MRLVKLFFATLFIFAAACAPIPTATFPATPTAIFTATLEPTDEPPVTWTIPAPTSTATATRVPPTATPTLAFSLPPPAVTPISNTTIIQLWHYLSDPVQLATLQRLADKFNAANPTYFVQPILQNPGIDYRKRIGAAIQAGVLPDLMLAEPGELIDENDLGALVPLDPFISDAKDGLGTELIAEITPANFFFDTWNGKTLGIAPGRSGAVLFYNLDVLKSAGFSNAPATWDEFDKICAAVTKGDNACWSTANIDPAVFAALVSSRGGNLATPDEKRAAFNDAAGIDALKWLKNQSDKGWAKNAGDFTGGKVAFAFASTATMANVQDAMSARKDAAFQWNIAPVPAGAKGKTVFTLAGPSFGIGKTTPAKQKGAFLFIKFVLQKDNQIEWAQRQLSVPAVKSAREALLAMDAATASAANARYGSVAASFKKAMGMLAQGVREPQAPAWQSARPTIATMLNAVITGKPVGDFAASDPEGAAREGAQRVNAALDAYGK